MSSAPPRLAEVVAVLEDLYPLGQAEDWDRVGLVLGVDAERVSSVHLAVDPTVDVARAALTADLLITHHPLLLRGVSELPASTGKGRVVTELMRSRTALWCGHTNADRARSGTAAAMIRALDLQDAAPLVAPEAPAPELFGLGAVGSLAEPLTVAGLCRKLATVLPATVQGAKHSGPGERRVDRVAICPGAGDSLLDLVQNGRVDAYITSDLRHHAALEHLETAGDAAAVPALIDIPHWAAESLWLPLLQEQLQTAAEERGWTLDVSISERSTDPWTGSA